MGAHQNTDYATWDGLASFERGVNEAAKNAGQVYAGLPNAVFVRGLHRLRRIPRG